MARSIRALSGMAFGLALCASSSFAATASLPAQVPSINPYAAIGMYASPASAAALCGNSASSAAAGAAAAAQGPAQGCVLPVTDPLPPPVAAEPVPLPPAPVAASGFGISPILLGLLGIAGIAALIASQSGDRGNDTPLPVSPA
jgi:hypothetical protein